MVKEEKYYVALDEYEHGVVIRSLNDEKTDLKKQGKCEIMTSRVPLSFPSLVLFLLCGWHS